jgi:hypothetical protein
MAVGVITAVETAAVRGTLERVRPFRLQLSTLLASRKTHHKVRNEAEIEGAPNERQELGTNDGSLEGDGVAEAVG